MPGNRVIRVVECECGCARLINVTTRKSGQRFFSVRCRMASLQQRILSRTRLEQLRHFRRGRFGQQVAAMVSNGRISERKLLEFGSDCWAGGYNAGYQARSRLRD